MLALGVVAGVCVTGSSLIKLPGTGRYLSGSGKQQRTLGFLAFLVVAASPLIRLWRPSLTDTILLQQTFLLAAIGLLALLLYALLQRPFARESASYTNSDNIEQSAATTHINADANITQDDIQFPNSVDFFDRQINLTEAANDQASAHMATQANSSNLSYIANLNQLIACNHAKAEIADSKTDINLHAINVKEENLDLSDADKLFAELRLQSDEIELPENVEWLGDFDGSVNLDDSLLLAAENTTTPSKEPQAIKSIIEGELLQDKTEPAEKFDASPATLSETLALGKSHTIALQQHIDKLNNKLNELQIIHQQFSSEQRQSQLTSAQMIINRDNLLDSEAKTLEAAENVISAQRKLLDHSKQQYLQIGQLLKIERSRLSSFRNEAARSKSMARQAATLARKAAVAHQTISDLAKREQTARLLSQESAKKAVNIARNAITALAAEERKNASSH